MPKRKHQKFNRPKKIFDIALIKEENSLIKKYGLKNRREVWKANFAIGKIRNLAKTLITADKEEQNKFLERQREKGFEVNSIADVLGLKKEDYLKRRLQSIVVKKGIASTHKQARQLVTHKHILMNGNFINSPSHLTTVSEESTIASNIQINKPKNMTDEEKKFLDNVKNKVNRDAEENE